ncbi:MAG: phytoene/squalene synthase family protein [Bacteroidales bacterium]|nr:phytoene/squalene synthase family protein [Bacteroidales bacterium]
MKEKENCIGKYNDLAFKLSKETTKQYSTSFYSASKFFDSQTRTAIHSVYGFVRLADEIVDSFHDYDKKTLLDKFEEEYSLSCELGISTNPILHSFLITVKEYNIPKEYIDNFLRSMRYDLEKKEYKTKEEAKDYIYGSADVVGLMCLKIFCRNNNELFDKLYNPAMRLGSAFQKVNFLRDLKEDVLSLGRTYFADFNIEKFDEETKLELIKEIEEDFYEAKLGIKDLPEGSQLAVIIAYKYYLRLLKKIKQTPAEKVIEKRIRVNDFNKLILLINTIIKYKIKPGI